MNNHSGNHYYATDKSFGNGIFFDYSDQVWKHMIYDEDDFWKNMDFLHF